MRYAEFYHPTTTRDRLIPACGSDSILYIDGRLGMRRAVEEAREACKRRGFNGFTMNAGDSLLRSRETRPLEIVKPLA